MKKKVLMISGCTLLLLTATLANGAEGPYVSGNLGLAILNDSDVKIPGKSLNVESSSGLALDGAIGYGLSNYVRLEGEIAYQKNHLDKANLPDFNATGTASSLALLFNGYFDVANKSPFTPYIGAGLGLARVYINDMSIPGSGLQNINSDDTALAYQLGAGLGCAINETITLDVRYRYMATTDLVFGTTTIPYSTHNLYTGVRINF